MEANHLKDNGRGSTKIGGISSLRTAVKARLRSKPEVEGQEHLNMYVLTRDCSRWGRMQRQSAEIIEGLKKDMKRIQKTMIQETLSSVAHTPDEDSASQPPPKRPEKNFGTFRVDY